MLSDFWEYLKKNSTSISSGGNWKRNMSFRHTTWFLYVYFAIFPRASMSVYLRTKAVTSINRCRLARLALLLALSVCWLHDSCLRLHSDSKYSVHCCIRFHWQVAILRLQGRFGLWQISVICFSYVYFYSQHKVWNRILFLTIKTTLRRQLYARYIIICYMQKTKVHEF